MASRIIIPPKWTMDPTVIGHAILQHGGPALESRTFWTIPYQPDPTKWLFVWAVRVDWAMKRARERGVLTVPHGLIRWDQGEPHVVYLPVSDPPDEDIVPNRYAMTKREWERLFLNTPVADADMVEDMRPSRPTRTTVTPVTLPRKRR